MATTLLLQWNRTKSLFCGSKLTSIDQAKLTLTLAILQSKVYNMNQSVKQKLETLL